MSYPWIFIYAILLHITWGITLLVSQDPLGITGIASLVHLGVTSAQCVSIFYLLVALLALLGLAAPKPAGFFFMLPQQLVLLSAAFGAINAMVTGTFADGTVKSSTFLITDQAPTVIAAGLHTLALWTRFIKSAVKS